MFNVLIGSIVGAFLFVIGFLLGVWLAKNNIQVVKEQLPPEIVRVPELRFVEKTNRVEEGVTTGIRVPMNPTPPQKALSETDRALQETLLNTNPEL